MLTGSLEIVLASFLVQALVSFYESREEWMESKYPEVLAKIAMGFIRLNQANGQVALIQRRNFLFQFKEMQELQKRISNGRDTEHFLDHPLIELLERMDHQRVTFLDADGKEYDFGSSFYGSGGTAVKGMNVSFKKTEDGTRLTFKVNHVFRESLQKVIDDTKGLSESDVGEVFKIMGSHAEGIKLSQTMLNYHDHGAVGSAHKISLKGLGTIFIGNDPGMPTMYDQITVQMEKGANIYEFHELLSLLDLDIALKESLFEDVERMKIGQLFRLFFPEDATLFERTEEFFNLPLEELKGRIFSMQPKMEDYFSKYLSKMELREILPGKMRFSIPGLADELRAQGALGLTTAITGAYTDEEIFRRVFTILEMGMLSSETRNGNGLAKSGLSWGGDLYTGGSDSVFTQLVTQKLMDDDKSFSDFYYHSKVRFCFSAEALESFTYQYHDDRYGTRLVDNDSWWSWGSEYLKRPNIFSFVKGEQETFNFDNEVMIKERIDPSFITSIVVDNDQTRDELMVYLRKKEMVQKDINGIDTILGIPWDQFIHVGTKISEELFSKT